MSDSNTSDDLAEIKISIRSKNSDEIIEFTGKSIKFFTGSIIFPRHVRFAAKVSEHIRAIFDLAQEGMR